MDENERAGLDCARGNVRDARRGAAVGSRDVARGAAAAPRRRAPAAAPFERSGRPMPRARALSEAQSPVTILTGTRPRERRRNYSTILTSFASQDRDWESRLASTVF